MWLCICDLLVYIQQGCSSNIDSSVMASGNDKSEDDTYDSALQRLMKECLPPILVDIVDKRPPDPIQYMAQSLYKYREKEDAALFNTNSSRNQSASGRQTSALKHTKAEIQPDIDADKVKNSLLAKGMIVESSEDFIDVNDDFEVFNISNTMMHEPCTAVMKSLGDIFDEDDVS